MNRASEADLGILHKALAEALLAGLYNDEGHLSVKVASVAVKFLKDNDITCSISDNQEMEDLNKALAEKRNKRRLRIVGEEE